MNAIKKLIKKIESNPHDVLEIEWLLDIAYRDTGIDKGTINQAAAELAAKDAVIEAAQNYVYHCQPDSYKKLTDAIDAHSKLMKG